MEKLQISYIIFKILPYSTCRSRRILPRQESDRRLTISTGTVAGEMTTTRARQGGRVVVVEGLWGTWILQEQDLSSRQLC